MRGYRNSDLPDEILWYAAYEPIRSDAIAIPNSTRRVVMFDVGVDWD